MNQKEFDNISLEMEQIVSPLAGSVPTSGQSWSSEITDLEVVELCEQIQKQAYMSQKEVLRRTRQIFYVVCPRLKVALTPHIPWAELEWKNPAAESKWKQHV